MPIAIANDMLIETVSTPANEMGPGIQDAQVLSTEGAKRVALVISVKQVRNIIVDMKLRAIIEGTTDLANWHTLDATLSLNFDPSSPLPTNATVSDVSVDGWPWVRVRYMLTADMASQYSTVRAVLLTATLSVAG